MRATSAIRHEDNSVERLFMCANILCSTLLKIGNNQISPVETSELNVYPDYIRLSATIATSAVLECKGHKHASTFRMPDSKNNPLVSGFVRRSTKLSFMYNQPSATDNKNLPKAGFFTSHSVLAVTFLPPTSNVSYDYEGNNTGGNCQPQYCFQTSPQCPRPPTPNTTHSQWPNLP
jgi:hypothetical protein